MSRDVIVQGIRTILWCSTWADHVEDHHCHNISGCRVEDHAPHEPSEAEELACELALSLERAYGQDVESMHLNACMRAAGAEGLTIQAWEDKHGARGAAERFGNCLAWEAMGAGVSWADDFPDHGFREHYWTLDFDAALGDLRAMHDRDCQEVPRAR